MSDAPPLATRLRLLMAVCCARLPGGGSGLEFSLSDLEGLSHMLADRARRLEDQAARSGRTLERAAQLELPPQVQRQLARLHQKQLKQIDPARREARLLSEATELYRLLLERAPAWLLHQGGPATDAERPLAAAQEALARAGRAQERCRRLGQAIGHLRERQAALDARERELRGRSAQLRPLIDSLAQRLAEQTRHREPLADHLEAPPELARLYRDLERGHGRAAALELERERLAARRARRQRGEQALHAARQRAYALATQALSDFAQARAQALALALELGRAAVATGRAAAELEEMLGPLRPRELAGRIAACRALAGEWSARAGQLGKRLASLDQARRELMAPEAPAAAMAAAPAAAPLAETTRLQGLMARARALYQERAALALARERQTYESQAQQAAHRLQRAAQSRELLRRKLAQRQEQARRALAEVQSTKYEVQDRQEKLEQLSAELEQGKRLALKWREELGKAQAEADSWRKLAQGLRRENAQALQEGRAQQEALRQDAEALQARVEELQEQMRSLTLFTAVSSQAASGEPGAVGRSLGRLGAARRRLARTGRRVALHAALILALGSALVLSSPNQPAKATLRDHTQAMATLQLRAEAPAPAPATELQVCLVPLDQPLMPLRLLDDRRFTGLAEQAGLSPYALYRSARAAHPDSVALEMGALEELAGRARSLAQRHPDIFADLAGRSLPASFCELLAAGPAKQAALGRFTDRLYEDYRRLGYGRDQALSAVITNRKAAEQWVASCSLPHSYLGRVRPVPAVETMGLKDFLQRLTPYITERSRYFLKRLGKRPPANLENYSRGLAFDMYGAAKHFQVPLSYLLAIAHQETFYANVLGDDNLSASPFQIWRPTLPHILRSMAASGFSPPPEYINLQKHLTLATYLAAFHLRELMLEASVPATRRLGSYVDMDKVMLRYNGSPLYAGRVAVRRAELSRFVALNGG